MTRPPSPIEPQGPADMNATTPPADDIELLLPWYAAGTLSPTEAKRVEEAIARDPALAERLALTREEMDEAIGLAESLPAPSPRARDRVFDRIAAMEEARPASLAEMGRAASTKVRESGFVGRLLELFSGFAPRQLAYAGIAAALLVVAQAGIIGTMLTDRGPTYGTASGPGGATAREGTFALVGFAPGVTLDRVAAVLTERGAAIVDGPRAGGLYRIRIAPKAVSNEERDRLLTRLREARDVVSSALPSQ